MNTPRPIRSLLLALALVTGGVATVALTAAPAAAQGDPRVEARTRYMAGKAKFDGGDFRGAIADFSAADQLAPHPMNDYNIALSYERLGESAQAVRYYRSYLNKQPTAANRAEVEASLARLSSAAAEADRLAAEEARRAEEARQAEEARRAAELAAQGGGGAVAPPVGGGTGPASYAPTGDAELDRVAAVDLNAMRGASPLPPPSANAAAAGGAPVGGGGEPPPVKKSKPIYKNPVFWVVVAVGVYALVVLSSDDDSQSRMLLPEGPAATPGPSSGVLLRF